jgi:hypothetical protein
MTVKKPEEEKLTVKNTKQEMLNAYHALLQEMEKQNQDRLKPEKIMEEKKTQAMVQTAEAMSTDGVVKEINELKLDMGKMLSGLSHQLEQQVQRFQDIQQAIDIKEKELREIYEIEKTAAALAALIEAQNQKRDVFEREAAQRKETLENEMRTTRAEWEKEKKEKEARMKELDAVEAKRRDREKEEFTYAFQREQQLARNKFADETAKLEKEVQARKEGLEKELKERTRALAEAETELKDLRTRAGKFPSEMESAVSKAVKETSEKLQTAAKNQVDLSNKQFEGERNVLTTRIESLQATVKQQAEQIVKLTQHQEMAYEKIQNIALKAIEGSSNVKSSAALQQTLAEHLKKQIKEEE